ncbi:MAG: hypothetical protein ACLFOY_06310 [Desulfatibacillaceae bacterium]
MSRYNLEQSEVLAAVRRCLSTLPRGELLNLRDRCSDYLAFRRDTALFLDAHFADHCGQSCYESEKSACCQREGIITFFADVVVNALVAEEYELNAMAVALARARRTNRCVYLGPKGCLWRVKPIVCEMFLCRPAKQAVFGQNPAAEKRWAELEAAERTFKWPDRSVLFDDLETIFLSKGVRSPLMYLHNSPGLLAVKKRHGLPVPKKHERP